jgi:hypothetical protein
MHTPEFAAGPWARHAQAQPSSLPSQLGTCPPSLRQAPASFWRRLWFWLAAPAPHEAAPPVGRLGLVRDDFLCALLDIDDEAASALRRRIELARSLRELWHLRAEVYRLVGVAHSQAEAEDRLATLNRHFPARAPRSGFAPLG